MLGKIDLPPAFGPAQLSDALPRCRTDVLCHASMIGLAFALYLAHTLFGVKGEPREPFNIFAGVSLLRRLHCPGSANNERFG